MIDKAKVVSALLAVIDGLNLQLPADRQLARSAETALTGESGGLDSLGLVSFIVAAEQKIESDFHAAVTLTDNALLSSVDGPLRTVDTLAEYITAQLNGRPDAR